MQRRSTTRSTPRKKYTVDAFEGIPDLQDSSATSSDEHGRFNDEDDDDDDDASSHPANEDEADFRAPSNPSSSDDDDDDEMMDADSSQPDAPAEDGDDDLPSPSRPTASKRKTRTPQSSRPSRRPTSTSGPNDPSTHFTRGVPTHPMATTTSLPQRRYLLFGPEYEAAVKAREWWGADATLPGRGRMRGSFWEVDGEREARERGEGEVWEGVGGVEGAFARRQRLVELDEGEAASYLDVDDGADEGGGGDVRVLLGPYGAQKPFTLPVGASMRMSDAWPPSPDGDVNYKNGFLLNLGCRVNCLEWATYQEGPYQYLAVSLLPRRNNYGDEYEGPPAFTPQPPYKACVRVYALKQTEGGTIDGEAGCELNMVLCTAWGDVREMKFCPSPLPSNSTSTAAEAGESLGLLALLHTDGAVRIFHLPRAQHASSTPIHLHIQRAAFTSRPPNTVCTTLAWLSSTRIAAGCANGFIAIWDISSSLTATTTNPHPLIYTPVSTSYILSLTSCLPSRPSYLITTSVSGNPTLTDLSSSSGTTIRTTTIHGPKSRIVQRGLIWHDALQSGITAEDNNRVVASPVRRFFTNHIAMRAKSQVTALAGSPCHAGILVGSAGGEVVATNPMGRVMDTKASGWEQIIFAHDWRRGTREEEVDGTEAENFDAQGAMSRIVDGFKAERVVLGNEGQVGYDSYNGVAFATVYEEESAVTALAWNPNLQVGGWAAAGMGDGLLRVEDVAT